MRVPTQAVDARPCWRDGIMIECEVVYCFVDTDVLVHFQTFDEVEWPAVANSPEICLVLASTVMAELNELKDSSRDWRGKRARTLISKLKSMLKRVEPGQPVEIRSGVSLMDLADEPIVDWAELGLDSNVNDDRLLATIICFAAQHTSKRTALVSNDFNALRKARRHGISTIDPEENQIKRFERLSDKDAELERLKARIRELENRIPRLELALRENDSETNTIRCTIPTPAEEPQSIEAIERILEQKRLYMEGEIAKARTLGLSTSAIEAFRIEFGRYLEDLEPAMALERVRNYGRSCPLRFVLTNAGSAVATDVVVSLQFPSDSFVVVAGHDL
jgi:predicted ribonuclease YlaK